MHTIVQQDSYFTTMHDWLCHLATFYICSIHTYVAMIKIEDTEKSAIDLNHYEKHPMLGGTMILNPQVIVQVLLILRSIS